MFTSKTEVARIDSPDIYKYLTIIRGASISFPAFISPSQRPFSRSTSLPLAGVLLRTKGNAGLGFEVVWVSCSNTEAQDLLDGPFTSHVSSLVPGYSLYWNRSPPCWNSPFLLSQRFSVTPSLSTVDTQIHFGIKALVSC